MSAPVLYGDFLHRVKPGWEQALEAILERARGLGPSALLVFDLDSTVFDNRPRQARILREFGQAYLVGVLHGCQPHHFVSGWDLVGAMVACGVPPTDAATLAKDVKKFWGARFFTSAYERDRRYPTQRAAPHSWCTIRSG